MKKIFLLLFATVTTITYLSAQTIQLTLKPGTTPNKVKAVIKSSGAFSGIISTVQVTFKIPKAGLGARPGTYIVTNFLNTKITFTPSAIDPASPAFIGETATDYYYTYNADAAGGATAFNFPAGTDVDLLEVGFTGPTFPVADFKAVQRTFGGLLVGNGGDFTQIELEGMANFFISVGGIDRTNTAAQFYSGTNSLAMNSGAGYNGEGNAALVGGIILPIKWLTFTADKNGNDAVLNWSVSNEETNSHYNVQRSLNGTDYQNISRVEKTGTGGGVKNYTYTDANINALGQDMIWYRIRQEDMDGRSSFTEIRNIKLGKNNGVIAVFPNPVSKGFYVKVPLDNPTSHTIKLNLLSNSGQLVQSRTIDALQAANYYFDISQLSLAAGQYQLQIIMDGEILKNIKLLVNKQ